MHSYILTQHTQDTLVNSKYTEPEFFSLSYQQFEFKGFDL